MLKIIYVAPAVVLGALAILTVALPTSAQAVQANRATTSATATCDTAPDVVPVIATNTKDEEVQVATIDSNPCGFQVEAAATCVATIDGLTLSYNEYGLKVTEPMGTSYADCPASDYVITHGGWRFYDDGTWVYHTYAD